MSPEALQSCESAAQLQDTESAPDLENRSDCHDHQPHPHMELQTPRLKHLETAHPHA